MNKIKFYRQKLGLTVRELSNKAKVAVGYISTLENDEDCSTNPTKVVMENIAEALQESVQTIFFSEEDK